jgi:hypothetical protein
MITYFKSINDTNTPYHVDVSEAIKRIRNGKSKELVEAVRQEVDKESRNERKKKLPAICFSGTFSRRADNAILEHSGLICIDFDGFRDEQHLENKRQELINDDYSYCVFTSPSGDGIKVLVRIPKDSMNHKKYFNSLQKHYNCDEFDITCKNISRVCYESYDPEIFVNELSFVWSEIEAEDEYKPQVRPMIKVDDTNEVTRRLTIWWNKSYGLVPGQRNNNLFVLAAALNEFGINQTTAQQVLMNIDASGEMHKEIPTIVMSAYRDISKHGTKFYEDVDKTNNIKRDLKMGIPKEVVAEIHGVDEVYEEEEDDLFWTKSSKGKVELVPFLFRKYLEKHGFYKYYPSGSSSFVFVRVVDNTINDVNEEMIKDFVLDYLLTIEDRSVYNFFALNTKFFQETFLNYVPKIDANFKEDSVDEAYLYYRNCAVKVTRGEIIQIDYKDLGGHVWDKQKILRDFVKSENVDCEFKKFVSNISGDGSEHLRSMESTLGYLMHSHKPASYCPAVILNDEVISDNPEGGTGKGIFVKSISHMKKMVIIDGKGFSFQKSFPYQRVQVDTQTLVFDDVSRHFDFERLFSVITEGITLEKKNKDEIHIPFERSPKIVITTNYAIKGAGNSFERRKWDLEFKQYYSKMYTPESEFGHMLFSGWDSVEWNRFDNYMIKNIQLYLNKGLVLSEFKNLKTRKFIAETSADFWEWCVDKDNMDTKANASQVGQGLFNNFIEQYSDYGQYGRYKLSHNKFYKWIDAYGEYAFNCKPRVYRISNGKQVEFIVKEVEQAKLNF